MPIAGTNDEVAGGPGRVDILLSRAADTAHADGASAEAAQSATTESAATEPALRVRRLGREDESGERRAHDRRGAHIVDQPAVGYERQPVFERLP